MEGVDTGDFLVFLSIAHSDGSVVVVLEDRVEYFHPTSHQNVTVRVAYLQQEVVQRRHCESVTL